MRKGSIGYPARIMGIALHAPTVLGNLYGRPSRGGAFFSFAPVIVAPIGILAPVGPAQDAGQPMSGPAWHRDELCGEARV